MERFRITKHPQYCSGLFEELDDYDEESVNETEIYKNIKVSNDSVYCLHYDANVIEDNEVRHLCRIFKSVKNLSVSGENILEYTHDLRELEYLEGVRLSVTASDEYTGMIQEDMEELQKDDGYNFAVKLNPK